VTLHKLDLRPEPFKLIKHGKKIFELRLYDQRRRLIQPLDRIEFSNRETEEKLLVSVESLHIFNNFKELYTAINSVDLGYQQDEEISYKDMQQYYPLASQNNNKVVAIKITLIN